VRAAVMATSWYFAYGSNMQSATLRGRRGIEFQRAVPARAHGWRLVFDKPSLLAVPESFANIVPDPNAEVLGVVYEITDADLAHLDLTEGVLLGNYQRVEVTVRSLANAPDAPRAAFTLTSAERDPTMQPSRRYMDLVIAGALEHGLPAEYVAALRAVPACTESAEAARLRPLIEAAFRRSPG
jgi:gamma-glutamylcyclotransferase